MECAEPAPAQAGVATANGFIVAIDPTDRRSDGGLAPGLVETIVERSGRLPQRLLTDTTAMTQDDIVKLTERYLGMTVYSPPPPERTDVTAETLRKRRWNAATSHPRCRRGGREWRARTVNKPTDGAS